MTLTHARMHAHTHPHLLVELWQYMYRVSRLMNGATAYMLLASLQLTLVVGQNMDRQTDRQTEQICMYSPFSATVFGSFRGSDLAGCEGTCMVGEK